MEQTAENITVIAFLAVIVFVTVIAGAIAVVITRWAMKK